MSREIKFRAWDNKLHAMISSERLNQISIFALVDGLNSEKFIVLPKDKRFYLMQYTGLKDRNGVEIYEGDLVLEIDTVYLVYCNEEKGCFSYLTTEFKTSALSLLSDIASGVEIIGNIHENPELLEE